MGESFVGPAGEAGRDVTGGDAGRDVAEVEDLGGVTPIDPDGDAPRVSPAVEATVANLESELQTAREQLLRQTAEFQNFRKRLYASREEELRAVRASTVEPFLGVLDDLERSLDAATEVETRGETDTRAAFTSLREGVELVRKKILDELSRLGVTPIDALGAPFDPHEHEAMSHMPGAREEETETVLVELQKGFKMGDRVLRHSRVIVAGPPNQAPEEPSA